jgi:hypothetical protein
MANGNGVKSWLSPVVAMSFVLLAGTGILLLCDVKNHPIMALHEWMGVVFSVAGLVHLIVNWRVFTAYFKRRSALIALIITLILGVMLIIAGALEKPHGPHGPPPYSNYPENRH